MKNVRKEKRFFFYTENFIFIVFKNTLEQDMVGDENNLCKQIFLSLLQTNRSEENVIDDNVVLTDVQELLATQSKWKTEESIFFRILSTRRFE